MLWNLYDQILYSDLGVDGKFDSYEVLPLE